MNNKESSLLESTYTQKSRLFLLPLTGLSKNKYFRETNTYIASPDLICDQYPEGISYDDKILIVTYSKSYKVKQDNIYNQVNENFKNISIEETGWDKYENTLMYNKRFTSFHESEDEYIYTFDLSNFTYDWKCFLNGRYSMMTKSAKEMIKSYRWSSLKANEQKKLYCYLYPGEEYPKSPNEKNDSNIRRSCFEYFSEELDIPVKVLKEVKELCSKPDFKFETYTCFVKEKMNET